MAEQRAESGDPPRPSWCARRARRRNLALKELRDLARGIHPAILTNRGLPAALEDLASRATVPVEVIATPGERLPDAVEAAAYFVVSECLANIGKHAEATSATVSVTRDRAATSTWSWPTTAWEGRTLGNGEPASQGLEDRVGALSGTLAVESPPGEGTRVVASIPLTAGGRRGGRGPGASAARVFSAEEAEAIQGERRRHLVFRLGSLGIVAGVLVAIWALTGPRPALDRVAAARHRADRGARRVAGPRRAAAERGRHRRRRATATRQPAARAATAACATTRAPSRS